MNEKTLYIVVAATVLLFLAAVVFMLVQDSSSSYSSTSEAQRDNAQCTFLRSNFDTAVENNNEQKAGNIFATAESEQCEWVDATSAASSASSDPTSGSAEDSSEYEDWTVAPIGVPCQWIEGESC